MCQETETRTLLLLASKRTQAATGGGDSRSGHAGWTQAAVELNGPGSICLRYTLQSPPARIFILNPIPGVMRTIFRWPRMPSSPNRAFHLILEAFVLVCQSRRGNHRLESRLHRRNATRFGGRGGRLPFPTPIAHYRALMHAEPKGALSQRLLTNRTSISRSTLEEAPCSTLSRVLLRPRATTPPLRRCGRAHRARVQPAVDRAGSSQPPQRWRTPFGPCRFEFPDAVGEILSHVVQQKVGVGEDRLLRQLRKLRVAPGGLARRVATRATGAEEQLATFSESRAPRDLAAEERREVGRSW